MRRGVAKAWRSCSARVRQAYVAVVERFGGGAVFVAVAGAIVAFVLPIWWRDAQGPAGINWFLGTVANARRRGEFVDTTARDDIQVMKGRLDTMQDLLARMYDGPPFGPGSPPPSVPPE